MCSRGAAAAAAADCPRKPALGPTLRPLRPLPACLQMRRFNLGPVGEADCPVFDGMMEYFQVCG